MSQYSTIAIYTNIFIICYMFSIYQIFPKKLYI